MLDELNFNGELVLRLFVSLLIGTILGLEREYRSKAAGLRTMIMICLGSTIFTEISMTIGGDSMDRIAANIITGIGFLGAGVIFKDGLSVTGITTATAIWICAALGMAAGAGQYFISFIGTFVVLIVLIAFENVKKLVSRYHQSRSYKITFSKHDDFGETIEDEVKRFNLKCIKERDMKTNSSTIMVYEVYGREANLEKFNNWLKTHDRVQSYEY
jgi:putative Mg2+ transporter-C (MgtC) family protein